MRPLRKLILCFKLIIVSAFCFAQRTSFIPGIYQPVLESIYQFNFFRADSLLSNLPPPETKTNWYLLMRSNYYWWLILTGEENKSIIQNFDFYNSRVITNLGKTKIDNLSNENLYIIANAYAFKTRLELYRGNYIAAALNLNNCMKYVEACLNKEQEYEAFYLPVGLYNYFVDFAWNKYPITRPYLLTLPKGSVKKGFTMLYKIAISKDWVLNNEANYFLCKLFQETEKNFTAAEKFADLMAKRYPNNLAYIYNYFDVLLNLNKKDEAKQQLVRLNVLSKTLPNLTQKQREFYLNKAQNELKDYYKKNLKQ